MWSAQRFLLLVVVVLVVLTGLTCDDPPTKPPSALSTLFYMTSFSGAIYTYSVESRTADSIQTGRQSDLILVASPTGTELYAANANGFLYRMNSLNGEVLDSHAVMANYDMAISPDGELLAVMASSGLRIYATTDFNPAYETTAVVYNGQFTADGKAFIGVRPGGQVFTVNLFGGNLAWDTYLGQSATRVVPSLDGKHWYALRNSSFFVYSVEADSIIYEQAINYGGGDITCAAGTDYIFFTETAGPNTLPAPSHTNVFNGRTNQFVDSISTLGLVEGLLSNYLRVHELSSTRDGKWVLAVEGLGGGRAYLILNTATLQFDTVVVYAEGTNLHSPSNQQR